MRKGVLLSLLVLAAAVVALVGASTSRAEDEDEFLISKVEAKLYGQIVPTQFQAEELGQPGNGVGPGQEGRQATACGPFGEAGRGVFDKDISCDDPFSPDNELAIAVHPTDGRLLLAGSNDYQLHFVGNTIVEQVPSGWFFSSDGGSTWIDGSLPMKGSLGGGDPVPGFDVKRNRLVFASLSFVCGQFAPVCSRGNIEFATADIDQAKASAANGSAIQWSDQTIVNGNGSDNAAQQIFLDKEWLAVDNNATVTKVVNGRAVTADNPNYGNYYVTWSQFRTESGRYDESPIWFIRSTDGGKTWSQPMEISGRNPVFCKWQDDANDPDTSQNGNNGNGTSEGPDDPNACDQDQFSVPVVAPDGTLYVKFDNEQNLLAYELPQRYDSQILVVKSTDGGRTFEGEAPTPENQAGCVRFSGMGTGPGNSCIVPIHVVNEEDSYDDGSQSDDGARTAIPDYPLNVNGRTTLTGNQFRVNSSGNIFIAHKQGDLSTKYRVYVTFADNIDGVRPGSGLTNPPAGEPNPTPITNTEAFYAYSDAQGALGSWVGGFAAGDPIEPANSDPATRLRVSGVEPDDQFYLWGDANPVTGAASIGYMNSDPARTGGNPGDYVFDVATAPNGADGVPVFAPAVTQSSQPSHPNSSRFFRARVDSCGDCATFIGDYNGVAVGPDQAIHSVWTDMRRPLVFVDRSAAGTPFGCGVPLQQPDNATSPVCPLFGQDAFYGRIPPPGP